VGAGWSALNRPGGCWGQHHLPAPYLNSARGNRRYASWVKLVLSELNAPVEALWGILIQNGDGLLTDDRSIVNSSINEVHRATGDFYPVIQRLLPSLQAGKRGKERRMDVHNPALECAQKIAFQHAHKTGQHDEVDVGRPKRFDVMTLCFLFQPGPEFAWRQVAALEASLARPVEDSGRGNIAQHQSDLGGHCSRFTCVGYRHEIRAFSGAQYAQPESSCAVHPPFIPGVEQFTRTNSVKQSVAFGAEFSFPLDTSRHTG
jgi:hypothetical protein